MDLQVYSAEHRLELERLLDSPEWKRVISSGLVEEVKANRIEPNKLRPFIDTVVNQLLEFNEERVKTLVAENEMDDDTIISELAKWPENLNGKTQ